MLFWKRVLIFLGAQGLLFIFFSAGTVFANSLFDDPGIQAANRAIESSNQTLQNLPTPDTSYAYPGGRTLGTYGSCSDYRTYNLSYGQYVRMTSDSGKTVVMKWDGLGNIAVPGVYIWINGIYQGHYKIPVSVDDIHATTSGGYVYEFWIDRWENHWVSKPVIHLCSEWSIVTGA